MDRLTIRLEDQWGNPTDSIILKPYMRYEDEKVKKLVLDRLAEYEDTDLTPEEFKESVDFTLELNKKIKKVVTDLKYYLDTNEENGVVYIPKFVIEKMVNEHLKTNFYEV